MSYDPSPRGGRDEMDGTEDRVAVPAPHFEHDTDGAYLAIHSHCESCGGQQSHGRPVNCHECSRGLSLEEHYDEEAMLMAEQRGLIAQGTKRLWLDTSTHSRAA